MKLQWTFLLVGLLLIVGHSGCDAQQEVPQEAPQDDLYSEPPVLKLQIFDGGCFVSCVNIKTDRHRNRGSSFDGFKGIRTKYHVEIQAEGRPMALSFHGTGIHFLHIEEVPEDQRGTFTLTAKSESTTSATVQVECEVDVKVLLDGREVSAPFELTPGSHELTITGRFKPSS